jgi:hypothetical protein
MVWRRRQPQCQPDSAGSLSINDTSEFISSGGKYISYFCVAVNKIAERAT